jgi:cytochrome P450
MPTAIEEFLRVFAPVSVARLVAKDQEVGGCRFAAGQMVLLPYPAANRDPEKFARADEVVLDREANRHSTFGLGIHRCIGSNLARMELTVAVEEWLRRIPEFELEEGAALNWSRGLVRGPRSVPVRFSCG